MSSLLLTLLFACGDKQEDSASTEQTEETQPSSEPSTEDTSSEEPQDTAGETGEAQ